MRRGTSINLRFVRNCSEKGKRAGTVGLYGLGQEFVRKYESGSKSFRNRYCLGHTFIIQFSGENVPKCGSLCSTFIYTKIDRECSKNTKGLFPLYHVSETDFQSGSCQVMKVNKK